MFGKRSNPAPPPPATSEQKAPAVESPQSAPRQAPSSPYAGDASPDAPPQPPAPKKDRKPTERARSEDYYDVKTTVFNALIDTIDLTQLAKLDPDAAREEIRDIVSEIVAIKNVVMSIAEQEELLEDICNDVLGYGPLEPLLARDDIADIMVNGGHHLHRGARQGRAFIHQVRRQRAADEYLSADRQSGRPPRR